MSIMSIIHIKRQEVIDRIKIVAAIIYLKDHKKLKDIVFEDWNLVADDDYIHEDLRDFIDSNTIDFSNIDNWTNEMLEDTLNLPFFRFSMFENYNIIDNNKL